MTNAEDWTGISEDAQLYENNYVPTLFGPWAPRVADAAGTIAAHLFDANPLSGGTGSVAEIDFHVRADAADGPTVLDLTNDCILNDGDLVVTLDDGLVTILADDNMTAAAVGNVTALPGATTAAKGRMVTHATPSSAGSLGGVSGGSGQPSLGTYSDNNNGLLAARLGVPGLMVSNTPGWKAVNRQSPRSASFGRIIWLAWLFENNPGVRFTPGTPGRAESAGTWSSGMPTTFGPSTTDDYIYSSYV